MSPTRKPARILVQIDLAAGVVCADWLNFTPNCRFTPKTVPNLATRAVHAPDVLMDRVRKSRLIATGH